MYNTDAIGASEPDQGSLGQPAAKAKKNKLMEFSKKKAFKIKDSELTKMPFIPKPFSETVCV